MPRAAMPSAAPERSFWAIFLIPFQPMLVHRGAHRANVYLSNRMFCRRLFPIADLVGSSISSRNRPTMGGLSVADTLLDSALARKLNAFQPLAANELKALADIQSAPLAVKRGRQLTHEGQTGHKAFVLQAGWACSLQAPVQRSPTDHLVPGTRRLRRAAQCAAANRGPFLLRPYRCGGQLGRRRPHVRNVSRNSRASVQPCSGLPPATRRWLSSTSSASGGEAQFSEPRISSWSWLNG